MITYCVQSDGAAWKIVQGALSYPGYRSQASAVKAATAIASTVGLTGESAFVTVHGRDGVIKTLYASNAEPPTLDELMRDTGHLIFHIPADILSKPRATRRHARDLNVQDVRSEGLT